MLHNSLRIQNYSNNINNSFTDDEIKKIINSGQKMEKISKEEILKRVKEGDIIYIQSNYGFFLLKLTRISPNLELQISGILFNINNKEKSSIEMSIDDTIIIKGFFIKSNNGEKSTNGFRIKLEDGEYNIYFKQTFVDKLKDMKKKFSQFNFI